MLLTTAMLGSAAIGGGASLAGGLLSGAQSRSNAKQAFEYNKEMYQNRHQWEVDDLRAAGLNPILSAGGQPPSPTTAAASTPDYSQVGRDAVSAMQASSARDLMRMQTEAARAQAEQSYSGAMKNRADAIESISRSTLLGQEADVNRANPDLYKAKVLMSPISREVDNFFTKGKDVASGLPAYLDRLGSDVRGMFGDVNSAMTAHTRAERMEEEVRKRYPNLRRK